MTKREKCRARPRPEWKYIGVAAAGAKSGNEPELTSQTRGSLELDFARENRSFCTARRAAPVTARAPSVCSVLGESRTSTAPREPSVRAGRVTRVHRPLIVVHALPSSGGARPFVPLREIHVGEMPTADIDDTLAEMHEKVRDQPCDPLACVIGLEQAYHMPETPAESLETLSFAPSAEARQSTRSARRGRRGSITGWRRVRRTLDGRLAQALRQ